MTLRQKIANAFSVFSCHWAKSQAQLSYFILSHIEYSYSLPGVEAFPVSCSAGGSHLVYWYLRDKKDS